MKFQSGAFDAHFHLNPGPDVRVPISRFREAGGTGFNLVNLPDFSHEGQGYYEHVYERTVKLASIAREEGLKVFISLGPYPLDYFKWVESNLDPLENMKTGIDLACRYIKDGKADAIGEIGRPHFPVEPKVTEVSNLVVSHAFDMAHDMDIPVIMHTEDLDSQALVTLEEMIRKSSVDPRRVVKHHADPSLNAASPAVSRSVLANRKNVRTAIDVRVWNFLLESDYVDDPAKPDKVIPPDSVPKRAVMIQEQYDDYEDILHSLFSEMPFRVFGR